MGSKYKRCGAFMINKKIFDRILILSGILYIGLLAIRTISSPNFWSHLAQTKFSDGIISFLQPQEYVNTSYLYDWLLNLAWGLGGAELVISLNAIGLILSFSLLLNLSRKYGNCFSQSLALIISGLLIFRTIDVSPIPLIMIMISSFLILLSKNNKTKFDYTILFILQVLWSNLHNSFLLGPILIIGFIVQEIIDTKHHAPIIKKYILLFFVLLLSTFINPNFIGTYNQTFEILNNYNPIYYASLIYNSFSSAESIRHTLFLVAGIVVLGLIFSKKKLPLSLTIFSIIGFIFAFSHPINNPLFVTLSFPVIVLSIETIKVKLTNILKLSDSKIIDYISYITIPILAIYLIIGVVNNKSYLAYGSCSNFGYGIADSFICDDLPLPLQNLISDKDIKIVNQPSDGGYIAYTFNKKCFLDYRKGIYSPDIINEFNSMLYAKQDAYSYFITKYTPDLFILNALNKSTHTGLITLLDTDKWNLIYFDGITLILASDKIYTEKINFLKNGLEKLEKSKNNFLFNNINQNPLSLIGASSIYSEMSWNNLNQLRSARVASFLSSQILSRNKNNIDAYIQLGSAQLILNKPVDAEMTFNKGLALSNNQILWQRFRIACEINGNNDGIDRANTFLNSVKKQETEINNIKSDKTIPLYKKSIN